MQDRQQAADNLEQLIDSIGLRAVLEMISGLCHDKAYHVRFNWQDASTARAWEREASRIDKCASKVEV